MRAKRVFDRLGRAVVVSALVAVAGCGVTLGFETALQRQDAADGEVQMDRRTATAADTVRSEAQRYVDTMRTVAAALGARETLTADEFSAVTEPLPGLRLAGAASIAFVVPAANSEVAEVERRWRQRGATRLVLTPQGDGDHLFTVLARALDNSPTLRGLDQDQVPAAALAEARRGGQVTMSEAYRSPGAAAQISFVVAAPVRRHAGREFLGWAMLSVRSQSFADGALARAGQGLLDLELHDEGPGQREVTIAALRADVPGVRDLRRSVVVPVAAGTWNLHLAAVRDSLPGGRSGMPAAVTHGGLSLTVLLTILVWVLATGRERARTRVRQATAVMRAGQQEARQQAKLLQAVLNGISDGVGVVTPDGRFLLHNPAALRILGNGGNGSNSRGVDSWQEQFGLFRLDGVTPYPAEELPLTLALNGQDTDQVEMLVRNVDHPEGRVISVSARPLDLASGERGAVAAFHDITDRKHVETELRGFAGVVAHDLKAPLAAVRGYAELITDALDEHTAGAGPAALVHARRSAEKVIGGANRMHSLIMELLDYAAARDATLRIVDLSLREVVDDVVAARTDVPDETDGRPDILVGPLPRVTADRVLLRQVLDNLVGNAIKYTPPGQSPRIGITAEASGNGMVRVQVSDRGIGIPDGEHAAVFDSFHRASNGIAMPGTGLGLAICRRIVHRHGGHIEALPNPGGGTVFSFTLPESVTVRPMRENVHIL